MEGEHRSIDDLTAKQTSELIDLSGRWWIATRIVNWDGLTVDARALQKSDCRVHCRSARHSSAAPRRLCSWRCYFIAAKLGLLVGGSLPKLATASWALLFQEFGHFFGTMAIGLPIALLLGIKREAIGAAFSVGREPSLAIIGEK